MVDFRTCIAAALLALATATPSAAQWSTLGTAAPAEAGQPGAAAARKPTPSTAIPEPASIALFAAGVVGLLLGRRGSRSRHDGE